MILRKFQAFDTRATHYNIRQTLFGRSAACSMIVEDDLPVGIKAQALMQMRKKVRAIVHRATRKHATASKR